MKIQKIAGIVGTSLLLAFFIITPSASAINNYPNELTKENLRQYNETGQTEMWQNDNTNEIVVAVIDTGINPKADDLKGRITTGYDFINNTNDLTDTHGHGTEVSTCIAAIANNKIGIAGSAGTTNIKIAPYRIGDATFDNDAIYNAIMTAANRSDVCIINLSFGSKTYDEKQAQAVAYALSKNKILIAAAGNSALENDGVDPYYYPASYPGVISVGSINNDGAIAAFSQQNDAVDIYAPGESIPVIDQNNNIVFENGTSFSAAIVSGICTNLLSRDPSLTNTEIEKILKDTALPFATTAFGGWGVVQADIAITLI